MRWWSQDLPMNPKSVEAIRESPLHSFRVDSQNVRKSWERQTPSILPNPDDATLSNSGVDKTDIGWLLYWI